MIRLIRESSSVDSRGEGGSSSVGTVTTSTSTLEIRRSELLEDIPVFNKVNFLSKFKLQDNAVIKVYFEGKLIPWSMVDKVCGDKDQEGGGGGVVEIRVCRPHQNVKPKISESLSPPDLIRKKIEDLEARITLLENATDPVLLKEKTDKDLQLLNKQIAFLKRRMDEADQAEWMKKP